MAKKLLPMFLACFLLAAGLLSAVSAADDDIVAKGDCGADGNNVTWTLDSKGALTISGKGAIRDYTRNFYSYWTVKSSCEQKGSSMSGKVVS